MSTDPGRSVDAPRRRSGFALPTAIIALVLLSALVAGALWVSTEELRAGRTDVANQLTLAKAEWALERAIVEWDRQRNLQMSVGATASLNASDAALDDRLDVAATRVTSSTFWLTARATSIADGRAIPARRTLAASMRLVAPAFRVRAALTAAGAVTVDGGSIDGRDASGGTRCNEYSLANVAGVAVPDTSWVCGSSCSEGAPPGVDGDPPVTTSGGLTSDSASSVVTSGDVWAELAARPTIVLAGGRLSPRPTAVDGQCVRTDPWNWGDPTGGACVDHFAIIRVRGDAVLAAGSMGQGVLVVDGSLHIEAGARFSGVVSAANDIAAVGAGAEIIGAAFAGDVDRAAGSRVADGGSIRFSGCVVRRASLGVARLTRTPTRWWAELR